MKRAIVIAAVLMAGGFLLMGLPGYGLYVLGDAPFGHLLPSFHGDESWPIAILMGLVWPVGIPLFYGWLQPRIQRPVLRWAVLIALLYVWAVLLATLLHWNASRVSSG